MFQAGAVLPSSSFLLQLLTGPGDASPPLARLLDLVGLTRPEYDAFARGLKVVALVSLLLLRARSRLPEPGALPYPPWLDPLNWGLMAEPLLLAPMVCGKRDGLMAFALLLNAPMHCRTWAGSFESYRSTVRKRSWDGRFRGGISQACRKWEMFSICTKGIADCLYLTPGGTARLTSLNVPVNAAYGGDLVEHILAQRYAIFESIHKISSTNRFAQDFLNPPSDFVGCLRRVSVQAQLAHVLVKAWHGSHGEAMKSLKGGCYPGAWSQFKGWDVVSASTKLYRHMGEQ